MKHPQPEIFLNSQNRLEILIQELNGRIKELNSPLNPPQIAQDMILQIKKKKNHKQTKHINYNVSKDVDLTAEKVTITDVRALCRYGEAQ